jgi:hypothetical protein
LVVTADREWIFRPEARSVVTVEATSAKAIDASLQADADERVIGLTVGARVIVVHRELQAGGVVKPEYGVSEVAALLRRRAPEGCRVVAKIGLSGEGRRLLDYDEVVASLGDERAVGILGAVVAISPANDGERHEGHPKEQERGEPHLPDCDWKYARSVPIPPTPSSAPSAFKTVKPPFIWSISD